MDHLKTKVKEHELDRAEGDELKKLAIQYEIEKKKLDQIRMEEKLQLGKWVLVSNNVTERETQPDRALTILYP